MSRWRTDFLQHPFQASWKTLISELAVVEVDDQTVPTSVDELARLKMVIAYLDGIIANIDPDITPKSVWANFQPQLDSCLQHVKNYSVNKNINHIVQANEHADNLLTYLKPYFVLPGGMVNALQESARTYVSEVEKYVTAFREKATAIVKELEAEKNQSNSLLSQTKTLKKKIEDFSNSMFIGTAEKKAIVEQISTAEADVTAKAKEINSYHTKLLVGESSTQASVSKANKEIIEQRDNITALFDAVSSQTQELDGFHAKIFGEINEKTGRHEGRLEFGLAQRMAQLSVFEIDQDKKHATLFNKIEALLPGATSAGLATAYREMKDSFSDKITLYTRYFYGSLLALILAAVVMSLKEISIYPRVFIDFIEVPDWDVVLKALIYKVPFIAPAIWLAVFSSTRRSQYERLQQEYAHKESLATSYESYKKQLQELKGDSEALQKELISKAIEAIAYNASATLDGKHEDKLPIHQLMERMTADDVKKWRELFKPSGN